MQRIEIPKTNGGEPWSRRSMEEWFRVNVIPKGNSNLIKIAQSFLLDGDYAYNVPMIVLIHYILDRLIKDNKGPESIKVEGELMDVSSTAKSGAIGVEIKKYKIKGLSSPREELTDFMRAFTEKLAYFIKHEWACLPKEGEGIDLDVLNNIIGNRGTPNYLPLPMSPPPIHVIKGARDPSKGSRVRRVVEVQDIENVEADIRVSNERISKLEMSQEQHERRLLYLEELTKGRR